MASSSGGAAAAKVTRGKAVATAAACCAGVAAYEAYRRGWFSKTAKAVKNIVESAQDTAATLGTLAKDTREFLSSDSEVVPQSIRQAIKLASCSETQEAVQTHLEATIKGVLNTTAAATSGAGHGSAPATCSAGSSSSSGSASNSDAEDCSDSERADGSQRPSTSGRDKQGRKKGSGSGSSMLGATLEKVFSKKGSGFFSVIAASVARQTITTLMENASEQTSDGEAFEKYKDILLSEEGKQFVSDLMVTLVVEATVVYTDKTLHINTYDQILETAVKPQHKSFVESLCVKLCRACTETMMAPAPSVPASPMPGHGGGYLMEEEGVGATSLCTVRDYPTLNGNHHEGPHEGGCGSPKSVCSGMGVPSSRATSEAGETAGGMAPRTAVAAGPGPSSNANIVKDILTSAARDEKVRSFLVSLASSSSAATARVILEAFVPSWLIWGKKSASAGSHGPGGSPTSHGVKTDAGALQTPCFGGSEDHQRRQIFVYLSCFVLLVALWMYKFSPFSDGTFAALT
mmetsp:Transcript_10605/g.26561  ORF Transcript_10605/g.26561 Transcript_10605/m.26561 type:complete len:517 (+) Transcript_10605:241-1791(+)